MQIDTEGFDYEILKLFQFNTFLPKIIIFESLYSMDGTETNISDYVKLAKKYNANIKIPILIKDELLK